MLLRSLLAMICMMCWILPVYGQDSADPAQNQAAPSATHPANVPVDPTTPKGTLKVLADAMEQGDAKTLGSLLLAENNLETRMRDAQIAVSQVTAQLRDALVGAFGEQVLAELNSQASMQQRLEAIDGAQMELNGDTARVTIGPDKYDLKKIDGTWKLALGAAAKDLDPKMLEQSLEEMSIRSTVYKETAGEVAEGKYQSTEEVGQALQGKLMVAMMRQASATEPATTQNSR